VGVSGEELPAPIWICSVSGGDLGDGDELSSAAEHDPSPATPPSSTRSGLGRLASTGGEAILRTSQGAAAAWPAQAPRRKRGTRSGT